MLACLILGGDKKQQKRQRNEPRIKFIFVFPNGEFICKMPQQSRRVTFLGNVGTVDI